MFVYEVNPIDDWLGWCDPKDVFESAFGAVPEMRLMEDKWPMSLWVKLWTEAQDLARKAGWEGDIREGPFVSMLPTTDEPLILIAWKQDNNGTSFVASPKHLPWMDPDYRSYSTEAAAEARRREVVQ